MAAILSRDEFVAAAQRFYDDAERSGADYTRRSTARRKLEMLLQGHGVEEVAATAESIMADVRSEDRGDFE